MNYYLAYRDYIVQSFLWLLKIHIQHVHLLSAILHVNPHGSMTEKTSTPIDELYVVIIYVLLLELRSSTS